MSQDSGSEKFWKSHDKQLLFGGEKWEKSHTWWHRTLNGIVTPPVSVCSINWFCRLQYHLYNLNFSLNPACTIWYKRLVFCIMQLQIENPNSAGGTSRFYTYTNLMLPVCMYRGQGYCACSLASHICWEKQMARWDHSAVVRIPSQFWPLACSLPHLLMVGSYFPSLGTFWCSPSKPWH